MPEYVAAIIATPYAVALMVHRQVQQAYAKDRCSDHDHHRTSDGNRTPANLVA